MKLPNLKKINFKLILKTYWPIILLTIIAAILRLYNFRSTLMFLGDQARDAKIVRFFLKTLDPIIVGPTTSVGKIQLGPLYYYFMAPFLLLSNFDPIGPALAVAFIGIATVPILYFVACKLFNKNIALISAILFTSSNVVITATRSSWNPNPMPIVVILLTYFVSTVYKDKNYKNIIWIFTLFAIALQLHYMVLILGPALLLFCILTILNDKKNHKIIYKNIGKGLLVFFIFAIPLIIFDLMKDFLNTKGILEFFQSGHHSDSDIVKMFSRFTQRILQITTEIIDLKGNHLIKRIFAYSITIFSAIYFYFKKTSKNYQIIFSFFFSSLIFLTIYSGDLYEHYLGFLYPISIIIISIFLEFIFTKNTIAKTFSSLIITLIIFLNLRDYRSYRSLGWTIDDTKMVSAQIAKDAGDSEFNIVLLDDTRDYRAMQYRYFLEYKTNIKDYGEFDSVDTIYFISQWDYQNLESIELRELEEFFDTRLLRMIKKENAEFLEDKIIESWHFSNGPYVYKLKK